ncbi:MAG: 1-deoxy-D-xylulose-5-phosphate reductoisomerase [Acidimicrobiaceae bacterium]|nr:1-deoxy-D-xylulose-5-phosphate reductoisomerase [Acidimicrobiaceae bacterium]
MTTVSVLGSTGSIGTQTLEVVRSEPDRFRISALAAWSSVEALIAQVREFRPDIAAIGRPELAGQLKAGIPSDIEVLAGDGSFQELATRGEVVVNGVVGFAGLGVTLAALGSGRRLALANKESLIAAGPLVQPLRSTPGAELIPVDSEHSALHQCLRADGQNPKMRNLHQLVLTASGGPFRGFSSDDLERVTLEDALAHPTWSMGPKITVDSSTLMNKGLEVIEAHELFGVPYENIEVVVHPESIVHSMAVFTDGTTIAQLSEPDMKLPIAYALSYPERSAKPFGSIDWAQPKSLHFEPPDKDTFRCLGLAYTAGQFGGTAPAWMNGANEAAVDAFLKGSIPWSMIPTSIESALDEYDGNEADSIDSVIRADQRGRECVATYLAEESR